jgi:hypothetical protein
MRALHRLLQGARFVLAAAVLGGCASTPQASHEHDAEAKRFTTRPDAATIYVYRPDFIANEHDPALYVDDRPIGTAPPGAFFRSDVRSGVHALSVTGVYGNTLSLEVRSGEPYFVSLRVAGGYAHLERVNPEAGQRAIRACCALFENWAPGQRPLLR